MTSPLFLLARIDFPDFGHVSETGSDFWKLRFLKNPHDNDGDINAFHFTRVSDAAHSQPITKPRPIG
jgi:hypothetical protein